MAKALWLVSIGLLAAIGPSLALADEVRVDKDRTPAVWPQLSYSVAVGRSDGDVMGHLWFGVGAHLAEGQFVLVGADVDLRDSGTEGWLVTRLGQGAFRNRAMAPMAALYVLAGVRFAHSPHGSSEGPNAASIADSATPRWRLGVGASVPAAIQLACIGIPTMIEGGVDFEAHSNRSRGFLRAGWNF